MKLIDSVKNNEAKKALNELATFNSENLDQVDDTGKNILHWAVIKNNLVLTKVLCYKLSDRAMNAHDNDNMTALNYASLSNNQEIIDEVSDTKIRFVDNPIICSGLYEVDGFEEC